MLVVIGKGSGITGDARQFRHSHAVKFVQEVSTSAARFFAAEPLVVLVSLSLSGVSLSLSGVSLRLSGLLA